MKEEQAPLCKCGCCGEVKWNKQYKRWNTYIYQHHQKDKNHWNYGKKHTEETKKKMRDNHFECSDKNHPMYGKHLSKEHKQKLSGNNHWDCSGKNNPNWKGGISCEPYCDVWLDKEYKQSIKNRDNNECQNPDCRNNCNHLSLEIHHIDYNKKNCIPQNLLTLCKSCNSRANKDREQWQELYEEIMVGRLCKEENNKW